MNKKGFKMTEAERTELNCPKCGGSLMLTLGEVVTPYGWTSLDVSGNRRQGGPDGTLIPAVAAFFICPHCKSDDNEPALFIETIGGKTTMYWSI